MRKTVSPKRLSEPAEAFLLFVLWLLSYCFLLSAKEEKEKVAPPPFEKVAGPTKRILQKQWLNTIVFEGSRAPNPAFSLAAKGAKKKLDQNLHADIGEILRLHRTKPL